MLFSVKIHGNLRWKFGYVPWKIAFTENNENEAAISVNFHGIYNLAFVNLTARIFV